METSRFQVSLSKKSQGYCYNIEQSTTVSEMDKTGSINSAGFVFSLLESPTLRTEWLAKRMGKHHLKIIKRSVGQSHYFKGTRYRIN